MKKIILILMLLTSVAYAQCDLQCPAPYGLSSGVSRFFSSVTGQNFLAEKIGSALLKKAIKKNIESGSIKTDLQSFSVRDLKNGKFKSIEIKGKDVDVQGVYITSFDVKTLCDFNYLVKYNIPFVRKSKEIALCASLRVDNGKIMLADTTFAGSNTTLDINKFSKLLNYINPLDFSAKILENKEAKCNIQNVKISDKNITIDGRVTVLKDKE